MSTKKTNKPAVARNPWVDLNRINDPKFKLQRELQDVEKEIQDLERKREAAKKTRDFVIEKISRVAQAVSNATRDALTIQPYDAALKKLCERITGWAALRDKGATDEQIREKLSKGWRDYVYVAIGATTARGGERLAVWIEAKEYNAKPLMEGAKLIAEVRRVMGIPQPAKPAVAAGKPKSAKTKSKGKPTVKFIQVPAAPRPSLREHFAGMIAKKKAAVAPFRPQTYGQWLATVRGSLGKELGNKLDQEDPKLKKMYEEKLRPSDAAKKIKSDSAVDGFIEKMPQKSPVAAAGKPRQSWLQWRSGLGDYTELAPVGPDKADRDIEAGEPIDETSDLFFRKAYLDGKKASEASAMWKKIVAAHLGPSLAEAGGSKTAANVGYDGGLAVEIEGGQTYLPDQLKVAPSVLSDSLDNTRIMPRPPKFEERDTIGRIGQTIPIDGHHYCVFLANEKPGKTLYHLRPLAPKGGPDFFAWQREGMVIEGAVTRWESWDGDADKVPLAGVIVRSPDRGEWVLGFDEDVFYVEVEKVAGGGGRREACDRFPGFEHITIPGTKEYGAKLTIDVAAAPGGKWAAGFTFAQEGKTTRTVEPGTVTFADRTAAIIDGCEQLLEPLRFLEDRGASPDDVQAGHKLVMIVMDFIQKTRLGVSPQDQPAKKTGKPKKSKGRALAGAGVE